MKKQGSLVNTFGGLMLSICAVGCLKAGSHSKNLQVWHSPESSLAERVEVVSTLVTNGMKMREARFVLGEPTELVHLHGPDLFFKGNGVIETLSPHEKEGLELRYESKGGGVVCLVFEKPATESKWSEWRFSQVWSQRTNSHQFLRQQK